MPAADHLPVLEPASAIAVEEDRPRGVLDAALLVKILVIVRQAEPEQSTRAQYTINLIEDTRHLVYRDVLEHVLRLEDIHRSVRDWHRLRQVVRNVARRGEEGGYAVMGLELRQGSPQLARI